MQHSGYYTGLRKRVGHSGPGLVILLCSWARHLILTVSLTGEFLGKPDELVRGKLCDE